MQLHAARGGGAATAPHRFELLATLETRPFCKSKGQARDRHPYLGRRTGAIWALEPYIGPKAGGGAL
eukprot:686532-Pleurochrysis_carterae.AAC.1